LDAAGRVGGQQRVDIVLAGIAGFFQGRSPFVGQRLVVLGFRVR
jgi:hypothetical protein